MIDPRFQAYIVPLPGSLERLLACPPFVYADSPPYPETGGIYVFTEGDRHMYVGRTGNLRQRLGQHCRRSSGHNSAPFTFLLTREVTGRTNATYRAGEGRDALMSDPVFGPAFIQQNARVNRMLIRYVEEEDTYRQALLEVYVAVVLGTRYNDFDNH
jgi:GIY-YIG catalytic domain